jgi:hypothetical protein
MFTYNTCSICDKNGYGNELITPCLCLNKKVHQQCFDEYRLNLFELYSLSRCSKCGFNYYFNQVDRKSVLYAHLKMGVYCITYFLFILFFLAVIYGVSFCIIYLIVQSSSNFHLYTTEEIFDINMVGSFCAFYFITGTIAFVYYLKITDGFNGDFLNRCRSNDNSSITGKNGLVEFCSICVFIFFCIFIVFYLIFVPYFVMYIFFHDLMYIYKFTHINLYQINNSSSTFLGIPI